MLDITKWTNLRGESSGANYFHPNPLATEHLDALLSDNNRKQLFLPYLLGLICSSLADVNFKSRCSAPVRRSRYLLPIGLAIYFVWMNCQILAQSLKSGWWHRFK